MPKRTLEGAVVAVHGGYARLGRGEPACGAGRRMSAPTRLAPSDIETARRVALFSDLNSGIGGRSSRPCLVRSYDRDSLLFSAADPADRFFVVVAGAVKLSVVDADGNETIIEIIGASNSFAEAAMFGSGRFPVNAEAMAGARLITIEASSFLRKLDENRQLGLDMLAALGRWQLRLMTELRQLKAHTPAQRLGWYLLRLAGASTGAAQIKLPYRKSIIAGRIGRKACHGHWPASPSSGSRPWATR